MNVFELEERLLEKKNPLHKELVEAGMELIEVIDISGYNFRKWLMDTFEGSEEARYLNQRAQTSALLDRFARYLSKGKAFEIVQYPTFLPNEFAIYVGDKDSSNSD